MIEETQDQKESIKLTKNAKGDMQWEIKVLQMEINDLTLGRLEKINKELELKYGANK